MNQVIAPRVNKHQYKISSTGTRYKVLTPEEYKEKHLKYYYQNGNDRKLCRQKFLKGIYELKKPQRRTIMEHNLTETEVNEILQRRIDEDPENVDRCTQHFEKLREMIKTYRGNIN